MDKEIKSKLDEEILSLMENMSQLDPSSEEYKAIADNLSTLHKLRNDERKLDCEEEQAIEQNKDRYIRLGICVAEIIVPLMFYTCLVNKGFKFEETGTFTSTTFRNLLNRIKPTKK